VLDSLHLAVLLALQLGYVRDGLKLFQVDCPSALANHGACGEYLHANYGTEAESPDSE
jgi:hypothetical protein